MVLADDGRVGGEATAPQAVAQDHFALAAGLVFAFLEASAKRRLDAEQVKKLALTSVCMTRSGSRSAPTILARPPSHVARLSSVVVSRRMSSRSAGVTLFQSLGSSGMRWSDHHQACPDAASETGFHSKASQTLKTAVVAPIPSASVSTAVAA